MRYFLLLIVLLSLPTQAGKIAIIIDDVGDNRTLSMRSLSLDKKVALSVLPHTPFSHEVSRLATSRGMEVMLHQPMESIDNNHLLGPGRLLNSMSETELKRTLNENLDDYPDVIGVNNHMGSLMTQDPRRMGWIMSVLTSRGKFYIDSKTSPDSQAAHVAQNWHVPNMTRHIFLDHVDDYQAIALQFERLMTLAKRYGHAIAIGHPRINTLAYLEAQIPKLAEHEIELVKITDLVNVYYRPDYPMLPNPQCYPEQDDNMNKTSLRQKITRHRCQSRNRDTTKDLYEKYTTH